METPFSKRLTESVESLETLGDDISQASTTKPVKMHGSCEGWLSLKNEDDGL